VTVDFLSASLGYTPNSFSISNFFSFLKNYISDDPGNFETPEGKIVGRHDGLAFYTHGQRGGLGLGGGAGEPWFVVDKDRDRNVVIVAQGTDHPSLFSHELEAVEPKWLHEPPESGFTCTAKVRYRVKDQACKVEIADNGRLKVRFEEPQRAVTPGQAVVFYNGNECLGGATIDN